MLKFGKAYIKVPSTYPPSNSVQSSHTRHICLHRPSTLPAARCRPLCPSGTFVQNDKLSLPSCNRFYSTLLLTEKIIYYTRVLSSAVHFFPIAFSFSLGLSKRLLLNYWTLGNLCVIIGKDKNHPLVNNGMLDVSIGNPIGIRWRSKYRIEKDSAERKRIGLAVV